jgi:site-specific DNA-methyltransferase (adenine-specific)
MSESIVHNSDCLEAMRLMADNAFDLAICDPPYGLGAGKMAYLTETKHRIKQKHGGRLVCKKAVHQNKDWDSAPPPQEYFDQLKRVSKEQIIFGIDYYDWQGVGAGRIKWNKGFPAGVSFKPYETAYASFLDSTVEINLLWAGMQQAESLFRPMRPQGNKKLNERRIHPTQKPVLLYTRLLIDYAPLNARILDTHLGSGSSRIAAYDLGFDFVGYELDKDYFDAGNKRFAEHIAQPKLFDPIKIAEKQESLFA